MNEPRQPVDRKAVMLENVRKNVSEQATSECAENYLKSCEAHGGDMAEAVKVVRAERVVSVTGVNPTEAAERLTLAQLREKYKI